MNEPAPQSNAYWKPAVVSALDGSVGPVSERLMLDPSLTDAGALKVAVGGTLLTVTEAVYSVKPASLSWTLPFTVREPLSFVGHEALLDVRNQPVQAAVEGT